MRRFTTRLPTSTKLIIATTALIPLIATAADAPPARSGMIGFKAENEQAERALEGKFDAQLSPAEQRDWLQQMSSAPNHVGSPHDKENADFMLKKFQDWGWDAHIETFQVLYPTPKQVSIEMVAPTQFKLTLTEAPIAGDRTSNQMKDELPAYTAFGGDGDVTGDLVYVNYGMPDDYKMLERNGISVQGKIVIARYGSGWRGLKPKLAAEHGAIGTIIYSDPQDDGYGSEDTYPKGGARPPNGIQRGSVLDMPVRPGDPLTPNIGATANAKRLTRDKAETVLHIPVLPISYADAQPLLAALSGPVAPESWRGGLPITYHMGPGGTKVHMVEESDWSLKPLYNVIATLKGAQYPDEWVIRGNHHDGWVFGARDPLSGMVAMMQEGKALGRLYKDGWRPKRTIVYASWDGEEPALLGSTEWAEQHADELIKKGVLYLNSDTNGRGFLSVSGSHSLQHFANQVASELTDPESGVSVLERLRARVEVNAYDGHGNGTRAEVAAKGGDMPIGALGSGSDFTPFLQHLGIASLNAEYGGEDVSAGVYHSAYDSFDHVIKFVDPGMVYGVMMSKTNGRMIMRAADADVLPHRFGDFADTIGQYITEVHKLADDSRKKEETLQRLIEHNAFKVAGDPTKTNVAPKDEGTVPAIEFAKLDNALTKLKKSADGYDKAAAGVAGASPQQLAQANAILTTADRSLLDAKGLPGRPWYMSLIYAPGLQTGYGVKTLPGVREAIENKKWDEANQYAAMTAAALEKYAAQIDKATQALKREPVTE